MSRQYSSKSSGENFEQLKKQAMNQGSSNQILPPFWIPNSLFSFMGGIITAYILFRGFKGLLNLFKVFFCGKALSGAVKLSKTGKWAIVTGGTDGIGKAYAEELADEGLNIVLISRSMEKLETVSNELKTSFKVDTKIIVADFSKRDIYENIAEELKDLDIGVLVNNVGISYPYPEYFTSLDASFHEKLLVVNCYSVVRMTSIVLPGMIERKRGVIINVSSASGTFTSPLLASYSASKAFVDYLSRSINLELKYSNQNVIVQSVTPFYVTTKLSKIRKPSFTVPTPSMFVQAALNTVGVWDHTYGCFAHELMGGLISLLPTPLLSYIVNNQHVTIRRKYLKKYSKKDD